MVDGGNTVRCTVGWKCRTDLVGFASTCTSRWLPTAERERPNSRFLPTEIMPLSAKVFCLFFVALSLSLSAGRYCLAVTCRVVRCSQMDRWTSFVISFSAMRQPGFVIHKLSHHQSPSEVTFDCQSCGYSFSANFARFISFSHASEAARR